MGLLDTNRDVVLFCRDITGRPIGYPMRTSAVAPEALTFTTYRKSAKVRNIERDPRVCVFARTEVDCALRWVSVEGRARIVAPSEEEIQLIFGDSVGDVSVSGRVPTGMNAFVQQRLREGKRILLEVGDLRSSGILEGPAR
jgi:nitroimidazol reductase NimA-like FMN-containing flavoprotein (pyridoxamine 5'-phosphate oxidase superfamily)